MVVRKLGVHEEGICDCRATTVFANGNNVTVSEDLVPRTAAVRLNARLSTQKNGPLNLTRLSGYGQIAGVISRRSLPSLRRSWRRGALSQRV